MCGHIGEGIGRIWRTQTHPLQTPRGQRRASCRYSVKLTISSKLRCRLHSKQPSTPLRMQSAGTVSLSPPSTSPTSSPLPTIRFYTRWVYIPGTHRTTTPLCHHLSCIIPTSQLHPPSQLYHTAQQSHSHSLLPSVVGLSPPTSPQVVSLLIFVNCLTQLRYM